MKIFRILLLSLFNTLLLNILVAQEYQYTPMPTSDALWNLFYSPPASYTYDNREYSIVGDTIINHETWAKIFLTGETVISDIWGNILDINTYGPLYQGAYLESGKVVYFCSPDGTITTLYDFNLQVGDTVKFLHFEDANDPYVFIGDTCLIIKQIDSLLIQNHYRKCIIFKPIYTGDYRYLEEKWIEGIGSTHGILFPLNIRPLVEEMNETEKLTCFFNNNTLLWGNYNTCTVAVNEFVIADHIEIYPNPASQFLHIKFSDEIESSLLGIEIFDMIGSKLFAQSFNLQDKNCKIDIANLKSGVYLFVIYIDEKKTAKKLIIY